MARKNILGVKHGRLIPRREAFEDGKDWVYCDCVKKGVVHKTNVRVERVNVISGGTRSCGCLGKEVRGLSQSKTKNPKRDREFFLQLRSQGFSYSQIAEKFHEKYGVEISRARIGKVCKQANDEGLVSVAGRED